MRKIVPKPQKHVDYLENLLILTIFVMANAIATYVKTNLSVTDLITHHMGATWDLITPHMGATGDLITNSESIAPTIC